MCAGSVFHRPVVQLFEQLGDSVIERREREERLVPETREDPALRDLHTDFDLCLIARFAWTSRHHRHAVVAAKLGVGASDRRFVPARHAHSAAELIRHGDPRSTAEPLVREGVGIGIMMAEIGEGAPGVRRVMKSLPPIMIPMWLVAHREVRTSRRVRVVADLLAEGLRR